MLLLHFRWTKGLHEFLPLTQDWPHTLKNASKILPKSEGSLSYFHHYIPCQEASFTMFTFYNCCSNSRKWVGEKRSHKNCFIDLYKVYNILKNFKVTLFKIITFWSQIPTFRKNHKSVDLIFWTQFDRKSWTKIAKKSQFSTTKLIKIDFFYFFKKSKFGSKSRFLPRKRKK